ncbi:MAG: hypothetical protein HUJ94_04620 [Bacteroidales bacterium]|nr:hypothetical protein [Bacteroidales bacterium]
MRTRLIIAFALLLPLVEACRPASVEQFRKLGSRDEFGCYHWKFSIEEGEWPGINFYTAVAAMAVDVDTVMMEVTLTSPSGEMETGEFAVPAETYRQSGRRRWFAAFPFEGGLAWDEKGEWTLVARMSPQPSGTEGLGMQLVFD